MKSKVTPKKKITKVKVESEGDGDGVCGWLDSEILQLIALCEEMESEEWQKIRYFFETLDCDFLQN